MKIALSLVTMNISKRWLRWLLFTVGWLFFTVVLIAQNDRHVVRMEKWTNATLADTIRLQAADRLIRKSYWGTQTDSAYVIATEQYRLADRINHPYWIARSLHNIGGLQLRLGKYDEALASLTQARSLYVHWGQWYRAGQAAQALGNVYRKQGLVPEAMEALLTGLGYAERAEDRSLAGRAAILNSIGNLYLNQQDYERAAEHYEASLKLHEELGKPTGVAANLNNLSKVYTQWGRYATARGYLQSSLIIKRKRNDLEAIANSYKNIGDIFFAEQRLDSARLYYSRAKVLQDSLGLRGDEASSWADLGTVALEREEWAEARRCCALGLEQATRIGDLKVQVKNGDCLYQAQRKLGLTREALLTLETTYALRDSFLSAENTRMLGEIEGRYATDRLALKQAVGEPATWPWFALGGMALLLLGGWWKLRYISSPSPKKLSPTTQSFAVANTPASPPALVVPDRNEAWVSEMVAVIRAELQAGREVTSANLALQLATSERQLLRRCREATGKTTKQVLQTVRLDYARELIEAGRIGTVAELSAAVGFRAPDYFSRRFADRFGVRPSALLNAHR